MPDVAALIGPEMPMAAVFTGYAVVILSLLASCRSYTSTLSGVVYSVALVLIAGAPDSRD